VRRVGVRVQPRRRRGRRGSCGWGCAGPHHCAREPSALQRDHRALRRRRRGRRRSTEPGLRPGTGLRWRARRQRRARRGAGCVCCLAGRARGRCAGRGCSPAGAAFPWRAAVRCHRVGRCSTGRCERGGCGRGSARGGLRCRNTTPAVATLPRRVAPPRTLLRMLLAAQRASRAGRDRLRLCCKLHSATDRARPARRPADGLCGLTACIRPPPTRRGWQRGARAERQDRPRIAGRAARAGRPPFKGACTIRPTLS